MSHCFARSLWPPLRRYVGGEFIGGVDIMREMLADGSLAPLVSSNRVVVGGAPAVAPEQAKANQDLSMKGQ